MARGPGDRLSPRRGQGVEQKVMNMKIPSQIIHVDGTLFFFQTSHDAFSFFFF